MHKLKWKQASMNVVEDVSKGNDKSTEVKAKATAEEPTEAHCYDDGE